MANKSIRVVVLAWLALACATAMGQLSNDVSVVRSIDDIRRLSPADIENGARAEIEAVVTLSLTRRSYVWIEDEQAGIRLYFRNRSPSVQQGDRILVSGTVIPGESGPMLLPEEIQVRTNQPLPEPPLKTFAQLISFADLNSRVQADGRLIRILEKPSRWQVELESGTNRFWAEFSRQTNDNFSAWLNAKVRVKGICVRQVFDWGETVVPVLLVQSPSDVTILAPGVARPAIDPNDLPIVPIASLTRETVNANPGIVRVRGNMLDQRLGEHLVVRDSTGSLRADSRAMLILPPREQVDVWGTPAWEPGGVVLQDATFRSATTNVAAGQPPTRRSKPETLPVLTKAADVLALSTEEAGWRFPVKLRGVVLIYYPERRQFFVHDDSAGFYVSGAWNRPDIKVGDLVEVSGMTDPGGFAPMIVPRDVKLLGTAPMPPARRVTLFQMASGQYDSQWVEAHGVVRSFTFEQNLVRLKLTDPDGTLFVYVPAESVPAGLADSVVRIRGICTTHPNAHRQITSLVLWCPSFDYVKIEERGGANGGVIETQSIASLGQFHPHNVLQRKVKIEGVVTLRQDERTFFVQDSETGIEVQAARANSKVQPGDHVTVTGYPSYGNFGVVLRDGVFDVRDHPGLPSANVIFGQSPLQPPFHNTRVTIEGRLRYRTRINQREVLTMQLPGRIFEVDSSSRLAEAEHLPVGSLLRITGVYRVLVDEVRTPTGFQLLVDSNDDVEILEKPSWWTVRHTLGVVGLLVLLVAATTLWVLMLRRRVQEQTRSLQNSEMKFRSLVEQSLVGVYIIQDGRFAYVNPRLGEIVGYTTDELLAMSSLGEVVVPEDRELVRDQIERRVGGEVVTAHYSFRGLRKDGGIVHVEVLGSRTEFNGRPAVLGTALDITARKQAEEELFNSRQMLRTVLDTIPQRVFWKDGNSVFTGCNQAFASDCGYHDPVEILGKTDFDIHQREAAETYRAEDSELMRSGTGRFNYEVLHTRADSTQTWLRLSKTPLFDKHGRVTGVLGTYEDVTDHKKAQAALAEASTLMETLLANSPDYIYFKDRESRFVRASQSLSTMFKLQSWQDLVGKTDFDFFKEEHAKQAFTDEQNIIRTGKPLVAKPEKETHPDGRITWALTTKMAWRDNAGNIIGTFGISKDVTELKRAEARLAHEQGLFQALVENLPDAIYFKDRESRFVRMSRSKGERARQSLAKKFSESHPDEPLPEYLANAEAAARFLVGKTDFDIYPENRARPAYEEEQRILTTEQPLIGHIEKIIDADSGKPVWFHTTKMPWRDETGTVIGTFGVTRDITALKEAEAVLDYERELFRTLLDHFPDSIYFKDLESRFVRVSRSKAQEAMGILQSNFRVTHPGKAFPDYLQDVEAFEQYLLGKSDFETFAEERARAAFDDEQTIIRTGVPLLGKVERTRRIDGEVTYCLSTKMAWRNKEGQIIGTFGVSKDITALKAAEAQLETAHQRLVETSRLAGMAEVATDVLHNVGNVLNSVNISCSLAIDRIRTSKTGGLSKVSALLGEHKDRLGDFFTRDPRGQQIPEYLNALADHLQDDQTVLLKELEQLLKHIDHIKQIVAMQQSYAKVAGVRETITAVQLVEDALHINAAALVRHDVHVKREFSDAPPINTEKHKVLQILVNLIRNAKYAMDDAKRQHKLMTIRIGMEGGNVRIDVIDNGVGIPPENLTRIFGHGFTTRRNGHGFGLHSSAIAVKELGGSLEAHSEGPGAGATFSLLLPQNCVTSSESPKYESAAI